jgi:HK97 family phage prohead protease
MVTMVHDVAHAEFRADQAKRTISGLVVEWGSVAQPGGEGTARWRFARGSLHWSAVNRVKLNTFHERTDLVGVATALQDSPRGLYGTFKVAQIPEGDRALQMASDGVLDGFSIEVDFDHDRGGWEQDPDDPSVRLVRSAQLRAVALTGMPAFDGARVESVSASRDQRLSLRLDQDALDGVQAAADQAGCSVSEVVRRGLNAFTNPRPVYSLDAHPQGHSLVRDLWVMAHPTEGDEYEARARWQAHRQYQQRLSAQFATVTTSTASQVIEPGYRALLASIEADRPFYAAASKDTITSATPFLVAPANITETSIGTGAAQHTENVNPTDGTLTLPSAVTVVPKGISGLFKVTREILDSSNPAIDALAFTTMREDWNREAETMVYTELNGANGQGGTITAGQVPSGAQARTSAGAALPADLRKAILNHGDFRKLQARSVVASTRASVSDALEPLDMTAFAMRNVTVEMSAFITGTAAGDGDVFILGTGDLWCWSSPLLEFQWSERSGPAVIDLAIFGYFATRLVKPIGLSSIRHT